MATKPGIFHLPRPSFKERRSAQSAPAPTPVQNNPQGQPNMNLSEPIIGVGERSGRTYFRAGEVPEKITFTPMAPGTPPVPSPGQGPGMYNEFGQYNAPASPQAFAQGGTVMDMPTPAGAPTMSAMSAPAAPAFNINQTLQQYLMQNPNLPPQDKQDLISATQSISQHMDMGKINQDEAQQAFQHFTSSFAPPTPQGPQVMPDGSQGSPPIASDGLSDSAGSESSTPMGNKPGQPGSQPNPADQSNFGLPFSQGAISQAGVVPTPDGSTAPVPTPAAAMPGLPPAPTTVGNIAQDVQGASQPPVNAAPPPTTTMAPPTPSAPSYSPPTNLPTNTVSPGKGHAAVPILSGSPRDNMLHNPNYPVNSAPSNAGPPNTAAVAPPNVGPGDSSGPTGKAFDPQFAAQLTPDAKGNVTIPDYVHGGNAHFDQNSISAIISNFPPEQQRTAVYIAAAESGGNAANTGAAGEVGLFQIHPVNWPALTKALGTSVNAQTLKNPNLNAAAAAWILNNAHGNWLQDWTTAPAVTKALGVSGKPSPAPTPAPSSQPSSSALVSPLAGANSGFPIGG